MNQKIRMKRITAWLLVVCMVMLNSPLAAMKARAEGEATEDITKLDYTIKVTVEVGKTSYNVPMDYIKSVTTDDGKTAIQKTGNAYKLEPKKKYKCKIEGLEMNEHEVGFETPETAGEVMIKSDPAKIKIYFGDLSDFKVGDEVVATKNLDIAWTWEVDKSDVLSVTKDGKIKGLKNGTATVKRTFLQNGTAFSNEVTVHVIGESQYTLNYKYKDEMIGEDSDIQITIEDKNNTKIEPNGGKYTLVWGEKYTYNITDSKGVKNPEGSREFTPDRNETSVIIPIDLDLPIFQLEGIDITSEAIRVKTNETDVPIICTNSKDLYDLPNWKIQINNGDKQDVTNTNLKIDTKQGVCIQYYYKDIEVKKFTIQTFSKYNIRFCYGGIEIKPKEVLFNGNTAVNDLKANREYSIEKLVVNGLTYTKNEPEKLNTKYTEVDCPVIELSDKNVSAASPNIVIEGQVPNEDGIYEFYYGTQITVKINNISSYLNGARTGWEWECKNGSKDLDGFASDIVSGDVISKTITLEGETEGEYILRYVYGDGIISSNEIKIKIKKIVIHAEYLPGNEKSYDGNNEFKYNLNLNCGYFKDQDNNVISYSHDIVLDCTVDGSSAGEYRKIRIIKAETCNKALDTSNLVNKEISHNDNPVIIHKLTAEIKVSQLGLHYMDQDVDEENSVLRIGNDLIEPSLIKIIFQKIGDIKIESKNECSVDTSRLEYDDNNIKFKITGGKTNEKEGKTEFSFQYTPQLLTSERKMQNRIEIKQQQSDKLVVLDENNRWINASELYFELIDEDFKKYYKNFSFKEVKCSLEGESYKVDTNIDGNVNTDGIFKFGSTLNEEGDTDKYYQVIISDENRDYKTIAMYLRIVSEKNKDKNYPTTIIGDDGNEYSIVNLYLDATEDTVTFKDSLEGKNIGHIDDDGPNMKAAYMENGESIGFEITNSCSKIQTVQYKFVRVKQNAEQWVNNLKSEGNSNAGWITAGTEPSQEKMLPSDLEDGDYVMFVKVTDQVGNVSICVSNGFVVDNVPPELKFFLNDKEVTEEELSERIYKNENQKVTIQVIEENIGENGIIFEVVSKNHAGEPISVNLDQEDIQYVIENNNTYTFNTEKDANYTINVKVTDQNEKSDEAEYKFTIDTTAPEVGSISIKGFLNEITENGGKEKGRIETKIREFVKSWNSFVERIYSVFAKETVEVTMTAQDSISDVEIFYFMTDKAYTESQLREEKEIKWIAYDVDNVPKTKVNEREFVYMKVVDQAGNESYFNTKGIITDTNAPTVDAVISTQANKKGYYNGDVKIGVSISETTGSTQAGASGLQYVAYRVESNGKITESKIITDNPVDEDMETLKDSDTEKTFDVVLDAEKHNNNDVRVYITAIDNAGNVNQDAGTPICVKIDSVSPVIDVAFDDGGGEEYYNHTRTATVTIKERNLDIKDVDLIVKSKHGRKAKIGKWSHSDNIGKSDNAVYTCRITFDEDDDYEFSVNCIDKAGNEAQKSFSDKFTVDKTKPIIDVSYSNGQVEENGYYNEPVTATITITEHNFDAGKADIQIQAGEGAAVPASGFRNNGDSHMTSVIIDKDGEFRLHVTCVDEAGNEADAYQGNTFHIDLKNPEITIRNVKDKSANKDEVKPIITCTDQNYDAKQVGITVRGENGGEISLEQLGLVSRAVADGEEFTLDFPKDEAVDDIYTLTAEMKDKAGNATKDSIQFSVNRYGSVYTLGAETSEWLKNGECSYIREEKEVVIIETNVDEVTECSISYTEGGVNAETVEVKEIDACSDEEKAAGTYYEAKELDTGSGWHQYQYTVSGDNFEKEGKYSLWIDSKDKAGNHVGGASSKHQGSSLEILFAVDRTAPSAVVTGTENRGIYKEDKHTVLLDVQDNIALDTVQVYLNGKEYALYDAEDVEKLEDGLIPIVVKESIITQTIQLKAVDKAGNILGEKANGEYDKQFEDFDILVTQNIFAQLVHTYWLIVVIGIVGAGLAIVFVVTKKGKEQ